MNVKNMYDRRPADVPRTSHHLGPQDVPQVGPIDVPWTSPFKNFEYLFFQKKNSGRCVKQRLLYLKNTFFIKSWTFVLAPSKFPEGPLEVPDVTMFRGPSEDVPGASRAYHPVDNGTSSERSYEVHFKSSFVTNGRPVDVRQTYQIIPNTSVSIGPVPDGQ